jgi:hypothetical protein
VDESAYNRPALAKFQKLAACISNAWMVDLDHAPGVQKRTIPSRKRSARVTKPEISNEPRHPSRFEKKKNMPGPL